MLDLVLGGLEEFVGVYIDDLDILKPH